MKNQVSKSENRTAEDSAAQNTTLRSEVILNRCHEQGFALVGVCDARPSDYGEQFRQWIAAGKHGEMAYLARHMEMMIDPEKLLPGVKSIICVADRYHDGRADRVVGGHLNPLPAAGRGQGEGSADPRNARDARKGGRITLTPALSLAARERGKNCDALPAAGKGRIARYARGEDYHKVMKRRLNALASELRREHSDHSFRVCVDTAPVMEREHAQRAGLGAVGKHTLLIGPVGFGSWLLLGEILTTLPLEPTKKVSDTFFSGPGADPCGGCTRCIEACPTGAIEPWSVDATKCISYLTIEHRSAIDEQFHRGLGDWIFGCDICQEVCPHNQPTRRAKRGPINPAYQSDRDSFDLLEVLHWTESDRRAAFTKSAMKRAKLEMMKRNAMIAMKNRRGS